MPKDKNGVPSVCSSTVLAYSDTKPSMDIMANTDPAMQDILDAKTDAEVNTHNNFTITERWQLQNGPQPGMISTLKLYSSMFIIGTQWEGLTLVAYDFYSGGDGIQHTVTWKNNNTYPLTVTALYSQDPNTYTLSWPYSDPPCPKHYTMTYSLNPGDTIVDWTGWDFSDGVSPKWFFAIIGVSGPQTQTVSISPASQTVDSGTSVTFTAGAVDANGHPISSNACGGFTWTGLDGLSGTTGVATITGTATSQTVTFNNTTSAPLTQTVTVKSPGNGNYAPSNTATATITINPAASSGRSVTITTSALPNSNYKAWFAPSAPTSVKVMLP